MNHNTMDEAPGIAWRVVMQATVELHEIEYRGLRLVVWRNNKDGAYLTSCHPFFNDINLATSDLERAKGLAIVYLGQEMTRLVLKVEVLRRRARITSLVQIP